MATEIPQTPTAEMKKAKKDKSSKKRRREDEQQNEAQAVAEPSAKKSKKQSKLDARSEQEVPVVEKKHKIQTKAQLSEDQLESHSPFVHQTTSFYLSLSACAHDFPLEGLCAEHISPLLLTYFPPLKGIVLSYSNPRLSEHPEDNEPSQSEGTVLSKSIDEYGVTFVWLTADFLLFRPRKGAVLEGHINLQNESILGLVCYNYFNAGIERSQLPSDWQWVSSEDDAKNRKVSEEEGEEHYVNGNSERVNGRLLFRVTDFESTPGAENGGGTINISGSLLPPENSLPGSSKKL
ncbi:Hypothetical protein R9X50_00771700 [Acrodontium crateriforme]|uniref:DNA-directed RNA polymerase subunit n=1 Tax=Acrodontium crateriforme TaxID=150365 RepID=A0AAQ3MBS5_9PEZI|nr:Hypothetical protein R9X50_00771700 [Acrodontium crateriforme]